MHLPGPGTVEVMGTAGGYGGNGLPVMGVWGALLTLQRQQSVGAELTLGFGSLTTSTGGPLVTSVMQLHSSTAHPLPAQRLIGKQGAKGKKNKSQG